MSTVEYFDIYVLGFFLAREHNNTSCKYSADKENLPILCIFITLCIYFPT